MGWRDRKVGRVVSVGGADQGLLFTESAPRLSAVVRSVVVPKSFTYAGIGVLSVVVLGSSVLYLKPGLRRRSELYTRLSCMSFCLVPKVIPMLARSKCLVRAYKLIATPSFYLVYPDLSVVLSYPSS